MDKTTFSPRRLRPSKRRLIQLYAALLYNAHLKGFIQGEIYTGPAKALCVPGLNCYSCPGAVGACPLGALQNALAATGRRAGFYVLGILLLFGLTLGRTICGWLCPFGLIQELLYKVPTPKLKKGRLTRGLSRVKYGLLAVLVLAVPLWVGLAKGLPLPAFCKYLCPAGTLEGAGGLLAGAGGDGLFPALGALFTVKVLLLLGILLACVFCFRAFCRFLCPLGAIYALFHRLNLVGVRVDPGLCNGCGACLRHCGMDVRRVGDGECIHCAACMEVCAQKAISLKAGNLTLRSPADGTPAKTAGARRRRTALQIGAAALLCFALLWFNWLSPTARASRQPAGTEPAAGAVGSLLPDFTADCLDGSVFRLADQRGKVVFLNLWATWCGPCVEELPRFQALQERYGEEIAVLAVHASPVTEDVSAFLAERGLTLPAAVDKDGAVWTLAGGGDALPRTLVLDREGRVIWNQIGSVTPEALEALYRRAAEAAPPASEEPAGSSTGQAGTGYRILVTDEAGTPVPGVTLQFCSDTECILGQTDAEGTAVFEMPPGTYYVHLLRLPEGWAPDETDYPVPESGAELRIVLHPAS